LLACYELGVKKLNMNFMNFPSDAFKEMVNIFDLDVSEAGYGDVFVETFHLLGQPFPPKIS
jgi:hypothetical protein